MIISPARLAAFLIASAAALAPATATAQVYFGEDQSAGGPGAMTNSFAARDAFTAKLSGFGVEGFESFATGTNFFGNPAAQLNFAGAGVTASLTGGNVLDAPFNARFAVEGTKYLNTSFNQTITFAAPVAAFGLFVTDANEQNNDPATVTVGNQLLTQQGIEARPFDSVDGIFRIVTERSPGVFELLFAGGTFPALDSTGMFVGLVDRVNPYTNIILINGASGLDAAFTDGFGYDGIMVATVGQLAPIPEPSTWALMLAGLVGVVTVARRRASGVGGHGSVIGQAPVNDHETAPS